MSRVCTHECFRHVHIFRIVTFAPETFRNVSLTSSLFSLTVNGTPLVIVGASTIPSQLIIGILSILYIEFVDFVLFTWSSQTIEFLRTSHFEIELWRVVEQDLSSSVTSINVHWVDASRFLEWMMNRLQLTFTHHWQQKKGFEAMTTTSDRTFILFTGTKSCDLTWKFVFFSLFSHMAMPWALSSVAICIPTNWGHQDAAQ